SSARKGAIKLHQSALAPLPCRNSTPGLPRSPHVSVSIAAPRTSTNERSGAFAMALSNHAGAGGLRPPNPSNRFVRLAASVSTLFRQPQRCPDFVSVIRGGG